MANTRRRAGVTGRAVRAALVLAVVAGWCCSLPRTEASLVAWIPALPPWVIVGIIINQAANVQTIKRAAVLLGKLMLGQTEQAKCAVCDELVTRTFEILAIADSVDKAGSINCNEMCPFKIKRCVALCEKIVVAVQETDRFPCVALKMCPPMDEFGALPECKFEWKTASCQPAFQCSLTRTLPVPQCGISAGYSHWRKYSSLMSSKTLSILKAAKDPKMCGASDADPNLCISAASGQVDRVCEYLGWVLVSVVATILSIHAIETPGGDDDRQWLSFWLIFFAWSALERFTSVFFSNQPGYYPGKLLILVWLVCLGGAGRIYTIFHHNLSGAHRMLRRTYITRIWVKRFLDFIHVGPFLFGGEEVSEEGYIAQLEKDAVMGSLALVATDAKTLGLGNLYAKFTSPSAIVEQYNMNVYTALMRKWEEMEARYLQVVLKSASDLPVMDFGLIDGKPGMCDAFATFFLVPPPEDYLENVSSGIHHVVSAPPRTAAWLEAAQTKSKGKKGSQDSGFDKALRFVSTERNLFWSMMGIGPRGAAGQYNKTTSSTNWGSLDPVWDETLELALQGGKVDGEGQYLNPAAPFTCLRVELWDQDSLSNSDFIGEATVPLCMLLDGRVHTVEVALKDPEGKSQAKTLTGSVKLELHYLS